MIANTSGVRLADERETAELAARFSNYLQPPFALYLQGDLGVGKTTFARALIHALGYSGRVKSPTYGLLETYSAGGLQVLHLDLYRVSDPRELEFLAIRDLFAQDSLLLVEWPENGTGFLPDPDLRLLLSTEGTGRVAMLAPHSERGKALAEQTLGAL